MPLMAGVARVSITPPIGSDLTGFMSESRKAEGVLDDVFAKALVLAEGETKVAIICCDLLGVDADFARLIKWEIRRQVSISPQNIMICASHTHSSAAVHFLRGCGAPFPKYIRSLGAKLVAVTNEAAGSLWPVVAEFGRTEYNLALNRRERRTENTMEQESGTVDNEVGLVRIDDGAGASLALIYNYAAHPVILGGNNKKISADYPGAASRYLEQKIPGVMAFFLQGGCGNINPKVRGDFALVEKVGAELGRKVLHAWKEMGERREANAPTEILHRDEVAEKPAQVNNRRPAGGRGDADEPTPLLMAATDLTLPLDGPPSVEAAEAEVEKVKQEIAAKSPGLVLRWKLHWAEDVLHHVREGHAPRAINAPVQALRIGHDAIVAIPGEEFVETGMRIKRISPADHTLVAAYSNSANMGYVPIREAYPKMGYEVYGAHMWYGLFRLAPGAAEAITSAALSLLKRLFSPKRD